MGDQPAAGRDPAPHPRQRAELVAHVVQAVHAGHEVEGRVGLVLPDRADHERHPRRRVAPERVDEIDADHARSGVGRLHQRASGPAAHVEPAGADSSARVKSATFAKRSAGTFESAFATAASTWSGTVGRTVRMCIAGSVMSFAITAWTVLPVIGGSPTSIS